MVNNNIRSGVFFNNNNTPRSIPSSGAMNQYAYYKQKQSSGFLRSFVIQTIGTLAVPMILNTAGKMVLGSVGSLLGRLSSQEGIKRVGDITKKVSSYFYSDKSLMPEKWSKVATSFFERVGKSMAKSGVPASSYLSNLIETKLNTPFTRFYTHLSSRYLGGPKSFTGKVFNRAVSEFVSDIPLTPYLYYMYMKDAKRSAPEEYKKHVGLGGFASWYIKSMPSQLISGYGIRQGIGLVNKAINSSIAKNTFEITRQAAGNMFARALYIADNMSVTKLGKFTDIFKKRGLRDFASKIALSYRDINRNYEELVNPTHSDNTVKSVVSYMTGSRNADLFDTGALGDKTLSNIMDKSINKENLNTIISSIGYKQYNMGDRTIYKYVPTKKIGNYDVETTKSNVAEYSFYNLLSKAFSIPLGKRFGLNISLSSFLGLENKILTPLYRNRVSMFKELKDNTVILANAIEGKTQQDVLRNFFNLSDKTYYEGGEIDPVDLLFGALDGKKMFGNNIKMDDHFYKSLGNSIEHLSNATDDDKILAAKTMVDFLAYRRNKNSPKQFEQFIDSLREGRLNILSNEVVIAKGDKTYILNRGTMLESTGNTKLPMNSFMMEVASLGSVSVFNPNTASGKAVMQLFRGTDKTYGYKGELDVTRLDSDEPQSKFGKAMKGVMEFLNIDKTSNPSVFRTINNMVARKLSYSNPYVFFNALLETTGNKKTAEGLKNAVSSYMTGLAKHEDIKQLDDILDASYKGFTSSVVDALMDRIEYINRLKYNDNIDIQDADKTLYDGFVSLVIPEHQTSNMTANEMYAKVSSLLEYLDPTSEVGVMQKLRGEIEALRSMLGGYIGADSKIKELALDQFKYKSIGSKNMNIIEYYNSLAIQAGLISHNTILTSGVDSGMTGFNILAKIVDLSNVYGYKVDQKASFYEIGKHLNDKTYFNELGKFFKEFNEYQTSSMKNSSMPNNAMSINQLLTNIVSAYNKDYNISLNKGNELIHIPSKNDLSTSFSKEVVDDFLGTIKDMYGYEGKSVFEQWNVNRNLTIENKNPGVILVGSDKVNGNLERDFNISAMTVANHINSTLSEIGLGFTKDYSSPMDYFTRLLFKRIIPGGIAITGLKLADSLLRSTPILDHTPLGGGISGLFLDAYANTKVASYGILDMMGVTDVAKELEEKYPGLINSPASGLIRGMGPMLAGLRYGGIVGAGVGLSAGVLLGGGPLGVMDDWDLSKSVDDIIAEFNGEKEVPVRRGRWWMLSQTPLQGNGVMYYRPHFYALHKSEYSNVSNMKGAFVDRVLGTMIPDYYTYKNMYSRPFPISSSAVVNSPVHAQVAPLANELKEGGDPISIANDNYYANPQNDFTKMVDKGIFGTSEMMGLVGFGIQEISNINDNSLIPEVQTPKFDSFYRDYWNMELGDIAGLCLTEDTNIITSDGVKKISEINIGDKVLTKEEEYKTVTHILKTAYEDWKNDRYILDIVGYCSSISATNNHWIPIIKSYDFNGKFISEVQMQDIKINDYLIYPHMVHDVVKKFKAPKFTIDNRFVKFLAVYLCSYKNGSDVSVIRNSNDLVDIEYVLNLLELDYNVHSGIGGYYLSIDHSIRYHEFTNELFSRTDNDNSLFMNILLSLDDDLVKKLLLTCSKIHERNSSVFVFYNISQFTDFFTFLLYQNIIPEVRYNSCKNTYIISVTNSDVLNGLYLKSNNIKNKITNDKGEMIATIDDNYLYFIVTEIKRNNNYQSYIYDITVDDHHTYVANNIIVHNTEPIRRFIPKESNTIEYYNPLPNSQPFWIPNSGIYEFKEGDPYTKIQYGEVRLPGQAYNASHKVMMTVPPSGFALGLTPEEQYNFYIGNPKFLNMFNQNRVLSERALNIVAQSGNLSKAKLAYDKKNNLGVYIEGLLRLPDGSRVPLAIGSTENDAARLNAYLVLSNMKNGVLMNPENNALVTITANKDQYNSQVINTIKIADQVRKDILQGRFSSTDSLANAYSHYDRAKILSDIAPYSHEYEYELELAKREGIASDAEIADIEEKVRIKNQRYDFSEYKYKYMTLNELIDRGVTPFNAVTGKIWESITHSRDIISTKLFGKRSALELYEQTLAYGPNFSEWSDPINTMLYPKLKAMTEEKNVLNAAGLGGSIGYLFGGPGLAMAMGAFGSANALVNNLTGREPTIYRDIEQLRNIDAEAKALDYVKNIKLYQETGDELYKYRASQSLFTKHALDEETLTKLSSKAEKPFIREFMNYNNKALQKRVLRAVPHLMYSSLKDYYNGNTISMGESPFKYAEDLPNDDWIGWNPEANMSDAELVEMENQGLNAKMILKGWDYEYRSIYRKKVVPLGFGVSGSNNGVSTLGYDLPEWF